MKFFVYSVRDDVAGFFGGPFVDHSDEMAIRFFKYQMSRAEGLEHDFAGDFSLYRVGTFDNNTGEITAEIPTIIFKGCEVVG